MNSNNLFSVLPVDGTDFPLVGRDNEIRRIQSAITRFQNISIVGETKIGKTSVLKSVENLIKEDPVFQTVTSVYIDLDKFSYDLKIDKLLERIIKHIFSSSKVLENKFQNYEFDKREQFSEIIEYCSRNKLIILIMLDNFDSITVLSNLTEDFFSFLRGNAMERGLSIITASRAKLETLCHRGQIAGSQFWNIFNPIINLSIFENEKHAIDLLNNESILDKQKYFITDLVGYHPCYLKIAANVIIENAYSELDSNEIIINEIYQKLKPYYLKCLKLLKSDEGNIDDGILYKLDYISTLKSISHNLQNPQIENNHDLINLKQLGYICRSNFNYKIYSLLFERFINEYITKPLPYTGSSPFIFISYSHADKAEVYEILDKLMYENFRFWFDEGIEVGSEWRKTIVNFLDKSHTFIVFISANSINSEYVIKEIHRAIKQHKVIIPVFLQETDLPMEIEFELDGLQNIKKYGKNVNFGQTLIRAIDICCKDQSKV